MVFFPVAHVALYGHGVVGGDFVALDGVRITRKALEFGLCVFDEQGDNFGFIFALAHGVEDEIAPGVEVFAQSPEVYQRVSRWAEVSEVEYIGP